jgi:hypothetical protein
MIPCNGSAGMLGPLLEHLLLHSMYNLVSVHGEVLAVTRLLADAAAVAAAAAAIGMNTAGPENNAHASASAGAGTSGAHSNSSQYATAASNTHDRSDNADAVKSSTVKHTHKYSSYSNSGKRFDQHDSSNSDGNHIFAMDSSSEDRVSTPDEDCYDSDYKNRRIDSNSSATHRKAGEQAAY